MGLRYGLLAALTLVLASALLWDRLHPSLPGRLADRGAPDPADLAVLVVGGTPGPEPAPAAPAAPPAVEAPGPAPQDGPPREDAYTVESGDTLGEIALRTLGTSRRAAELARHNGIDPGAPIRVGQVLRLPPREPAVPPAAPPAAPSAAAPRPAAAPPAPAPAVRRVHTVGRGDTLYRIAVRHYGNGGRWREIASANGLDPDGPLPVGRELLIP